MQAQKVTYPGRRFCIKFMVADDSLSDDVPKWHQNGRYF